MAQPAKRPKKNPLTDKMMDAMECPVCFKLPRGQVFQCERGHCVCADCRAKLTQCPTCRVALGQLRNLVAEQLLTELSHNCKFADHGCTFEETLTALESHEEECRYRLVNCSSLSCDTKRVSMAQLEKHIKEDHLPVGDLNAKCYTSGKFLARLNVQGSDLEQPFIYFKPIYIQVGEHIFFRQALRNQEGQWHLWLYMIGTPKECEECTYTIQVFAVGKKERLTYHGCCIPLDHSWEKVTQLGQCLNFSNATAKYFMVGDKIQYQVTIE